MQVPIVDFAPARQGPVGSVGVEIDRALGRIGFMVVTGLGVDQRLLAEVFAASKAFFTGPAALKQACAYRSAAENFGYQGLTEENLDPTAPADLKETFTMRNVLNRPMPDERWPSAAFRDLMRRFYADVLEAGYRLQRALAEVLELDEDFFVACHGGENVTLRLLYYPAAGVDQVAPAQMGAGAHTDYGLLTLLFQDHVGGLEVQDGDGRWQGVAPLPGGIVINSGDLLERWSNGRYRSTRHRVQPRIGHAERLSIAMFIDPDSTTEVRALPSCLSPGERPRYPPITAGEHLQEKLAASHKDRFA